MAGILEEKIRRDGSLPFPEFMAAALYDPELGYYASSTRQVGRGGDFFTSVSVGPLFGRLLARRFLREWEKSGSPARWRILECGAHDGKLAADVLAEISRLRPDALVGLEYAIAEPLPLLREAQAATLSDFSGQVRVEENVREFASDPLPGIVFGNELLDALPFHVVEWRDDHWHECRVALKGGSGGFAWDTSAEVTDRKLVAALGELGQDFPEGYRTEVRTRYREFLEPLRDCLTAGLFIWPDYGFARPEYYLRERKTGTLRTFSAHRAGEDPLERPGEVDITAHVDFTAVAEAAITLGCQPVVFRNQGSWLTENARDWLLEQEADFEPGLLRQFQTLVHPAHLGGSFHVLELSWNQGGKTTSSADWHRLALRACPPGDHR